MSFAYVSAERAAGLVRGEVEAVDLGMIEVEVLIALCVRAESWIVLGGCEINRCTLGDYQ
jgi:hypothetical protein